MGSDILAVLLLVPLLASVTMAPAGFATWFGHARGWMILGESLLFAGAAATAGTVFGVIAGRGGMRWAIVACLPLMVPASLVGSTWIFLLGRDGPLGSWLTVYDWPVAAAIVGWRYAGVAAVIVALSRRGDEVAARVFRVRRAWWWLELRPMLLPALVAWLMLLVLCGADHIMPSLFLIPTYGTQVLIQYNALFDLPGAVALAFPMLVVGAAVLVLVSRLLRREATRFTSGARAAQRSARLAALVAGGPLLLMLVAIASRIEETRAVVDAVGSIGADAQRTFVLAVGAGVVCTAIGWILAEGWLAARRAGQWSLVPLVSLNLVVPASLHAFGTLDLALRSGGADGSAPLFVAYCVRFAPIAMLAMFALGAQRCRLPIDAARILGVPPLRAALRIGWPIHRAALATAFGLVAVLVATELEMSALLAPAGATTLGVRLYTLIHTAPDSLVSATALATLVLFAPGIAAITFLMARRP